MTENKSIVARCLEGFSKADPEQILSCLADDVIWDMPGSFRHVGKEAFGKELDGAFAGHPVVSVARLIEEDGVVIAEGSVRGDDGIPMVFCDVFEMRGGKIAKLVAYIPQQK
ncbi:MAG: nuclear transport factor 2 family protein [Candidatus Peribacteraceae bacterium]|nr:nuclear transport factor 2 family protein [Candidatus Peribacteraceae bacterium]